MKWIITLIMAMAALPVIAYPDVTVDGLFKGKAMLTINGNRQLLKEGETSEEGVLLVSSDSKKAVVEYAGERKSLLLSDQISGSFSEAKETEVRISRRLDGHYYVGGSINGRHVEFMVDTGATVVSMNSSDGERLGVDLRSAQKGAVGTAGGVVEAHFVDVPQITVGGITVPLVKVAVLEGEFPQQILLGNSFLTRVNMTQESGVLVLRKGH